MIYFTKYTATDEDVNVILPTDNPLLGPVEYPLNTIYHWPNFDVVATDGKNDGFERVQGPFQFGSAVYLDNSKQQVRIWQSSPDSRYIFNICSSQAKNN